MTIGILKSSQQPGTALHFARYLAARDRGGTVFDRMGFVPVEGDDWAERPQIVYYSGAVNRIAIQETIRDFEEREGVDIKTVYNGCGILVGQMKLGQRPDIYHSCDRTFMRGIEGLFRDPITLSMTPMVILVAQDNPHGIRGLKDLTQQGLKVGVANEQQSALGKLTADLLKQQGLFDAVQANVVTRTPTADLLVNQIMTGSLDAVVVYRANAVVVSDKLELIPIQKQGANAIQTFAIGKNSQHRLTAERLFDAIQTSASIDRFQQAGFDFKLKIAGNSESRDE